MDRKYSIAIIG